MPDEKKEFVVKDRRIFSQENREGDTRDQETPASPATEEAAPAETAAAADARDKPPAGADQEQAPLPEINFATFIVSLNASALLNLGAIEDPSSGQTNKNLPMAKQTIDILSMLEEKTAGNLTSEEENLLKSILYELRIIYVKESG